MGFTRYLKSYAVASSDDIASVPTMDSCVGNLPGGDFSSSLDIFSSRAVVRSSASATVEPDKCELVGNRLR